MSVQFDWQEGNEHPSAAWSDATDPLPFPSEPPRTIVSQAAGSRRRLRLSRRWLALLAFPLLGVVIVVGVFLWQTRQGNSAAQRDIDAVAQQALAAQQAADRDAFAALLDTSDRAWREATLAAFTAPGPATVQVVSVALDATNRAVAEIQQTAADGSSLRQIAVYRRGDDGQWRLAAPLADDFGPAEQIDTPNFRLTYRTQDKDTLRELINLAEGAYVTLRGDLRSPAGTRLYDLRLIYEQYPALPTSDRIIAIPSPWLAGVTAAGRLTPAYEEIVYRQMAMTLAQGVAPSSSPALLTVIGDWAAASVQALPPTADERLQAARQDNRWLSLEVAWHEVADHNTISSDATIAQLRSMLTFLQIYAGSDAVGRLLQTLESQPPRARELGLLLDQAVGVNLAAFEHAWLAWLSGVDPIQPGALSG